MKISGYNYNSAYAPTDLYIAETSCANFRSIQSGSVTYGSSTYNLVANETTTQIYKEITSGGTITGLDDFLALLDKFGFEFVNIGSATSAQSLTTGQTLTLSSTTGSLSPIWYKLINTSATDYTIELMSNNQGNLYYGGGFRNLVYYLSIPCFFWETETSGYFGCISIHSAVGYSTNTTIKLGALKPVTNSNYLAPQAIPGGKGFRPIANRTKDTIGGGSTSGQSATYYSDAITQPGEPDETSASAIGSGFIRAYQITDANLANVGACLYGSTFLTALTGLFIDPIDAIISLNVFPAKPHTGSAEAVKLLNHQCTVEDLGIYASGLLLSKQFRQFDFGTLSVAEMWESFLDYDASSFSLYLPFIGSVDIPVDEVMNGSINVKYTIDFFTGMCVANVLCTKTALISSGETIPLYAQHSYQGNCAIQIPLTEKNYASMIGAIINSCTAGITHGLAAGVGTLAQSALSGAFKPQVQSKGSIVSNAGFCSVLYPYITIGRPVPVEPDKYQEVIGYPSYIHNRLRDCEGLCVCDSIDLRGVTGATESELNRIRQMCADGVYV